MGTVFDSQLKFSDNTDSIVKRANQRIRLLRKLNSFDISRSILCAFYQTFIESILTFSFICWFGGLSVKDKKCLNDIIKVCSKITGVQLKDLSSLWKTRVVQKADSILSHPDHVLGREFVIMPSGRWYYVPVRKTNRYANSFIPSAIRLLNEQLQDDKWKCGLLCTLFFFAVLSLAVVFVAIMIDTQLWMLDSPESEPNSVEK